MTISKTQTMRPAEIALIDHMNSAEGDITQLQEGLEETNQELGQEVVDRQQADTALGTRIDDETLARTQADTALGTRIDDETLARTQADTALGARIDDETLARTQADTALGNRLDTAEDDISTLQTNMATAQSDISTLQTNVTNSTTLETINYVDYISPCNNVTISSATLNRIGRICMLHVEFSLATEIKTLSQLNIFDIVGPYKPLTGCPASINGAGASAIINNTRTLWIKTFNRTYSGSHYMDCIYIHQ